MNSQMTLSQAISMSGVALHSGRPVAARLCPAPPNHGVVFVAQGVSIPARVDRVVDTQLATTLGSKGVRVRTVEHLLSTLMGMGIDNLRVEVEGDELPVLDGCCQAWVESLRKAGLCPQDTPRSVMEMVRPVEVVDGERWARIEPAPHLSLDVTIDFDHPCVGRQHLELDLAEDSFEHELAWARTFGFERYVPAMKRMGLVRGGTLENALVFGEHGPINPEGMRQADEPVRHKMMDVLGDLALVGHRVCGRLITERPGHGLIVNLARKVASQTDAWRLVA
jgi:UDP-3-O-[3-hydroxymyristoyl] N-acetylglucosamine deacetylase